MLPALRVNEASMTFCQLTLYSMISGGSGLSSEAGGAIHKSSSLSESVLECVIPEKESCAREFISVRAEQGIFTKLLEDLAERSRC